MRQYANSVAREMVEGQNATGPHPLKDLTKTAMRTRTLWIKEEYLQLILKGLKTIEVRVGYDNVTRLEQGDRLLLNGDSPFVIQRIGRYASFEEMLEFEDAAAIAPGVTPSQLLAELRAIYPPEKEALGAIALEIEPE